MKAWTKVAIDEDGKRAGDHPQLAQVVETRANDGSDVLNKE